MSVRIDVRVIGDDVHRHGLAFPRDLASDAPETDHTEGLSSKLDTFKFVLLPFMVLECFVRLRNIASQSK